MEEKPKKKKKEKSLIRKLQDELWEHCKRITRARYVKKDGTWDCYTCGHLLEIPAKCQTGHFIPNSVGGALLRYNLDNLRPQCYHCNINLGGNGSEFYRKLVKEKGQKHVDELFVLKGQSTKAIDHYIMLLDTYKKMAL